MDKEHLYLLINEEIYQIPGDYGSSPQTGGGSKNEVKVPQPTQAKKDNQDHGQRKEIPRLTEVTSMQKKIPFAVFHEASNEEEIQLLEKILGACSLSPDNYQVFTNGFDKGVKFEKALVFVSTAKKYYEPISQLERHFLCSRPLSELLNSREEKAKLWAALKSFLTI